MTLAELIAADPDEVGYAQMPAAAVAADLNERRHTMHASCVVTLANLLALGPAAADMLDALEAGAQASSMLKWTLEALKTTGIDIGHPTARAQVEALSGTVFTAEQVAVLTGLSLAPASLAEMSGAPSPVTPEDVIRARGEG